MGHASAMATLSTHALLWPTVEDKKRGRTTAMRLPHRTRRRWTPPLPMLSLVEPESDPITAAQVPGLLLQALPSLRERWPEVEAENADAEAAGGRLGYLDATWLVGVLADRLAAGETSEIEAAFDLIELLISNGDEYVSELGVMGYIEGLQTQTVTARGVDPQSFRPWLRPLSAKYWDAINRFWADGTTIPTFEPESPLGQGLPPGDGDTAIAERLTVVSKVGSLELVEPVLVRVGERLRVDRDARAVTVDRLDGTEHVYRAKPPDQ